MTSVTFAYGTETLTATRDTGSFRVLNLVDLLSIGPSRGGNFTVGGVDGTVARDHVRGEMPVALDWAVFGATDLTGAPHANPNLGAVANVRALQEWFDAAPGRRVTVTLDYTFGEFTGEAIHRQWSRQAWGPTVAKVSQLLVIPSGILAPVSP